MSAALVAHLLCARTGKHIDKLALDFDCPNQSPNMLWLKLAWLRQRELVKFVRNRRMLIINGLHPELDLVE